MSTDTPLADVGHRELLPGARNWSFVIRRGFTLRLTDPKGGANCSALFFNAHEKIERYNMADTLKAQHTARLTRGHVCYSDMGRILVSIVEDTCGWHDPIGGISNAALVSKEVIDRSILALVEDMIDTVSDEKVSGIGLAAPQIGVLKRVIVVNMGDKFETFINPEIEIIDNATQSESEGCLSIFSVKTEVKIPRKILFKAKDLKNREVVLEAEGIAARVFMHEVDHLNGILFIDHLNPENRKDFLSKINRDSFL